MGRKDIFEIIFEDLYEIYCVQFESYKEMVTYSKDYGILLTPMGVRWAVIDGKKVQIKQYRGE